MEKYDKKGAIYQAPMIFAVEVKQSSLYPTMWRRFLSLFGR